MNIKAIRKLPELQENQEWACEGGCDVIKPKYFENVFSQSTAHDGSSIKRQSEFFWTCQNNHLLRVWCTDQSDYILLPEDFYQAEAPKVVESNSIQESIDLLDQDIESIKNTFLEESLLTNEDADTLEQLITKAMQLGEFYAKRDAQAQAVPEQILENNCMIGQTWFMKGTSVSGLIKHAEGVYNAEAVAQNSKIEFGTDDNEHWFAHDVPFYGRVQISRIEEHGLVEWDICLNQCWQGPFNSKSECIKHLEECIAEQHEEAQEQSHEH